MKQIIAFGIALSGLLLGASASEVSASSVGESSRMVERAASSPPGKAGYLTLWDDSYWSDRTYRNNQSDSSLHNNDFNDKASSYVNKTDRWWVLYDDTGYRDRGICLRPRSHYHDLGRVGFNDKTSSVQRRSLNTCPGWPEVGIKNSKW